MELEKILKRLQKAGKVLADLAAAQEWKKNVSLKGMRVECQQTIFVGQNIFKTGTKSRNQYYFGLMNHTSYISKNYLGLAIPIVPIF